MNVLDRFSSLTALQVRISGILMVVVVGMADYATGESISMSVFYLIPIMFASWYDGRVSGIILSVLSALLWFLAETIPGSHPSILIPIWNASSRLMIFTGVAWMLHAIRQTKLIHLQDEVDRYARIVETAVEGVLAIDRNGFIRHANSQASLLLGYDAKELSGRRYTQLIHNEESATLLEEIRISRDHQPAGPFEIQFVKRDGTPLWTLLNASATFSAKKERDGIVLLMNDISDRKRIEENTQRQYLEIVALQTLSSVLARSLHLDRRLREALETVLEVTKFDAGVIYLANGGGKELILQHAMGFRGESQDLIRRWDIGRGITGGVCRTGAPQFIEDAVLHTSVDSAMRQQEDIRGFASIPLVSKESVLGVLNLIRREAHPFSESAKSMLVTFGRQIGVAVENAKLYEDARAREKQVTKLSVNLMRIQEDERKKFARELHEGLAQLLTMLRVNAQLALENLGKPGNGTEKRILEVIALVTEAEQEAKQISQDLRPSVLDDFGLKAAIEVLAVNFERRSGVVVDLHLPMSDVRFDSVLETTIYRIVQELLANIAKHAESSRVTIQMLLRGKVLALTVADNGKGFNIDEALARSNDGSHSGLRNLRERAESVRGVFHAESAPGKGTEFSIEIPFVPAAYQPEPQEQAV